MLKASRALSPERAMSPMSHQRRLHVSGFSLLEALVALTLLSTAGLVLFDWMRSSLQQTAAAVERQLLADQLSVTLQLVNLLPSTPEALPGSGEWALAEGWRAQWTAAASEQVRAYDGSQQTPSRFTLFWWDIDVQLIDTEERLRWQERVQRLGFEVAGGLDD